MESGGIVPGDGGGDTALGMHVDLSVNTILVIPGSVFLSFATTMAPVPMFAIVKLTDIIKFFMCRYLLNKEHWVKNLTEDV